MAGASKGDIVAACIKALAGVGHPPNMGLDILRMLDGLGRQWSRIYSITLYVNPHLMPPEHRVTLFPADVQSELSALVLAGGRPRYNTVMLVDDIQGKNLFTQYGNASGFDEPSAVILYRRADHS